MSIYVYAPVIQPGTRELIQALGAQRLVRHDGLHYLHKGVPVEFSPKDHIVCWGKHAPAIPDVNCLNASYKYPDLKAINSRGKNWLANGGINVFYDVAVQEKVYLASLPTGSLWWPVRQPTSKYVGFKQIYNYVLPYHTFDKVAIVKVFNGQFVDDTFSDPLFPNVLERLELSFGEIYAAWHGRDLYILFIDTAPALDAAGVATYAKLISKWAGTSLSLAKVPDVVI